MGRPPTCTCGECHKCKHAAYMRQWYQRHTPEERRAINARRDPEATRRSDQKRKGTPLRKASLIASMHRMREKYPEKYKARAAVAHVLRSGKLTKRPCEVCAATKVEGHHDDYSKPLEVRWLCRAHHTVLHPR